MAQERDISGIQSHVTPKMIIVSGVPLKTFPPGKGSEDVAFVQQKTSLASLLSLLVFSLDSLFSSDILSL